MSPRTPGAARPRPARRRPAVAVPRVVPSGAATRGTVGGVSERTGTVPPRASGPAPRRAGAGEPRPATGRLRQAVTNRPSSAAAYPFGNTYSDSVERDPSKR